MLPFPRVRGWIAVLQLLKFSTGTGLVFTTLRPVSSNEMTTGTREPIDSFFWHSGHGDARNFAFRLTEDKNPITQRDYRLENQLY